MSDRADLGERSAGEEAPPWEQPGCFRLDGEPHRGEALLGLGSACCAFGVAALFCPCFIPVAAVVNLPLGLTAWLLARRDLALMQAHRMDPRGEQPTRRARKAALLGLALPFVSWLAWGAVIGAFNYLVGHAR